MANSAGNLFSYVLYMENVLGLKRVILPETLATEFAAKKNPQKLLFLDESPWAAAVADLFGKMKNAMKLSEVESEVLFTQDLSQKEWQLKALGATVVVCFSSQIFSELSHEHKFLVTSPTLLNTQTNLKKKAWEDLQAVMKVLATI